MAGKKTPEEKRKKSNNKILNKHPLTFKELKHHIRDSFAKGSESDYYFDVDKMNYCIPVVVGLICQDVPGLELSKLDSAIENVITDLESSFGSFKENKNLTIITSSEYLKSETGEYIKNKLTTYCNQNVKFICKIKKDDNNNKKSVDIEDIKKYCWLTIAAWDGICDDSNIANDAVRLLCSEEISNNTNDNFNKTYKLKFPSNRPIYQIVLPAQGTSAEYDYTYRKIYPHLLESSKKNLGNYKFWFQRDEFEKSQSRNKDVEAVKENKFKANANKIKRFNQKICKFEKQSKIDKQNAYDRLTYQHYKKASVPVYAEKANLRGVYYDSVSMAAQNGQNSQTQLLMSLAIAGLFSFSIYSNLNDDWKPFVIVYLICLFLTYVFWLLIEKFFISHKDYLDFRTLAEGLRVQCYWYMMGITNESVGSSYTVKYQKDMMWAKNSFNAWYLVDYLDDTNSLKFTPSNENNDLVRVEWLGSISYDREMNQYVTDYPQDYPTHNRQKDKYCEEIKQCKTRKSKDFPANFSGSPDQFNFYCNRVKTYTRKTKKWDKLSKAFVVITLILSILLGLLVSVDLLLNIQFPSFYSNIGLDDIFIFIMDIVNIATIVIAGAAKIKAYNEQVSKYSYCKLLVQKALQDYDSANGDEEKIKEIFQRYGVEALEENAEWLMIKNDREPEVIM